MYSGAAATRPYQMGRLIDNMLAAAAHSLLNDIVRLHPEAVHNISCVHFLPIVSLHECHVTPKKRGSKYLELWIDN